LVPYAVSTAVMAVAFQAWYGSPLLSAPYRTPQISESHTLLASYLAFVNLFWSSHFGLIPVAPVVLLMLVATPLFCRRYGRWALFALAVAAVYVATVTFEGSEIGFSFSGRYMVWLIPFGSVPLLFLVTEYPIARWAFEAFAAVTGWLAVSVVLEPPATVSSNIALKPLSGRFMDIWPAVSQTGFANIWAVAAWTAGVLAVAAAVCAAEARVRRPAVAARIGAASRA
jgi:hypothetical protein